MKKTTFLLTLLFTASLIFSSCRNNDDDNGNGTGNPGIGNPTATTDPGVVINGVRWATRNLQAPGQFAATPQAHGRFWQWGTATTGTNAWEATQDAGVAVPNWNATNTDRVAWTAANDPCPAGWRLPTHTEFIALNGNQSANSHAVAGVSTWHDNWNNTGVAGRVFPADATVAQVTAATPTAIFLPAAGWRYNSNGALNNVGTGGIYWSSTASGTNGAVRLLFGSTTSNVDAASLNANGFSVRCVAEKI